jgi:uncharacterized protein (DUF1501 family)
VDDLEHSEIQAARLSTPASAIQGQFGRRAFLGGALATGGALALLPSWMDGMAAAATPIGADDGVLVLLQLGGGNDGLSMVAPMAGHADGGRYQSFRGNLATAGALPLAEDLGLHPALPKLKARYDAGQVAVVRGVGQTGSDLSHFTSTATWMAGTSDSARDSGWMGRWLDGIPESADGLRGVTIGPTVPLHLRGRASVVTALETSGDLIGADRSESWMAPVYDAVTAMGAGTTGRGRLSDLVADTGASAIALSQRLSPLFSPDLPDGELVPSLALAARLINADLGIRVIACSFGSFDLHDGHSWGYPNLMTELDAAVEAFFTTLAASFRNRVALATFSEFGRTVRANGSGGFDHGTASVELVIGDHVKGGLFGVQPPLDDLDSRGDLKVQVDFRSYYASIVDGWLAGGSSTVLGAEYEDLGLFSRSPGGPSSPPTSTTGRWKPFADPATLVRQQYLDFLGRPADAGGVSYWVTKLTSGSSIPWVIESFLSSKEFGVAVGPAARLGLVAFGGAPAFDDLMGWATRVRAKEALASVASDVVAEPAFTTRYGTLADDAFVAAVYNAATGNTARSPWAAARTASLGSGALSRADVLAEVVSLASGVSNLQPEVDVTMTYAGLLRRSPDRGGFTYWTTKVGSGTSIQRLIAQFFASAEYAKRFA